MAKKVFRGVGGLHIDVVGAQVLIDSFKSLGEDAVLKLAEPSVDAAKIILNRARSIVPVDEGVLKRSLKVYKPGKRSRKSYKMIARVGFPKTAAHGVPLELGHRMVTHDGNVVGYVEPRPYLRPAADSSKLAVSAIMSKAMSDVIKEARGK